MLLASNLDNDVSFAVCASNEYTLFVTSAYANLLWFSWCPIGGSVYIRYPSANASSEIKVRVSGGTKIPVLDIHNLTDETSKKAAIKTYIVNC